MDEQSKKRGPKKQWTETMVARFPDGIFKLIEQVLQEEEDRTEFVRVAVAQEIARRRDAKGLLPIWSLSLIVSAERPSAQVARLEKTKEEARARLARRRAASKEAETTPEHDD